MRNDCLLPAFPYHHDPHQMRQQGACDFLAGTDREGRQAFHAVQVQDNEQLFRGGRQPKLCQENDERLTKVGKFLRNHHLDELPQLWCVARGDMSFVGPRPERKYYIDKIMEVNPDYERLYELRPGLFSEATLTNGYTGTLEKMLTRLEMDLDYLENRTLWRDTQIIFKTVTSILGGKIF